MVSFANRAGPWRSDAPQPTPSPGARPDAAAVQIGTRSVRDRERVIWVTGVQVLLDNGKQVGV